MADDFDVTFGGGRNKNLNVKFEEPQQNLTLKNTAATKTSIAELNDSIIDPDAKEDGSILVYEQDTEKFRLTSGNIIKGEDGVIRITGPLIPTQNNVYDLGSEGNRFRTLYLAGQTIAIGNLSLSDTGQGTLDVIDNVSNAVIGQLSTQTIDVSEFTAGNTTILANGSLIVLTSNSIFYGPARYDDGVTTNDISANDSFLASVGFVKTYLSSGEEDIELNGENLSISGNASLNILTVTGNSTFGDVHILGDVFVNNHIVFANTLQSLSQPVSNNDLTTKLYVDSRIANVNFIANGATMGVGQDITDGAVTSIVSDDTIYEAIDKLNEAMLNINNNSYVRSVTFTANPTSGGAGTSVTLSLLATGSPNQYTINWGDGTVDTTASATPSHTYVSNANSPFDIAVTARNTSGSGEGSNATFSRTDYVTIYLADPVPSFTIHDALSGGSTTTEANTGETIYIENTTTNIPNTDITATFSIDWGDGGSIEGIDSKVDDGGPQGARLGHTYSTDSGSGRFTITLAANSFSAGDPGIFPLTTTANFKVFDTGIAAPNDLTTKTISWASSSSGTSPKLAAGFTENASGKSAGDSISSSFPRYTSGTVSTASMSTYFHNTGSITQLINDSSAGSPTTDESGVDYYNYDATGAAVSAENRIYAQGLYETGAKARISYDVTSGSAGVNKAELSTIEGNSNELFYVYDTMTSAPTVDVSGATITEASASYNYISGVPYYDSGDSLTLSGVVVTNLTGQTYRDTSSPFIVGDTNIEGSSGTGIADQSYTYSTALAVGDITGSIPNAGISSASLEDLTVNVSTGDRAVRLTFSAYNVNGDDTETITSPIIQVFNGTDVINEAAISVADDLGAGFDTDGVRITGFTGATPSFGSTTDFYVDNAWSGAETVAGTDEAIIRYGSLTHFDTDLSSGYLPTGPDLATGRSGTQYFRFAFKRTAVSNFRVRLTGKVSGFYVAAPGTAIDSASTLNGWVDASIQYAGSGVPGADTGNGGNGSNGCAFTGADRIIDGTSYSNQTFDLTLGTVSSTNSYNNQILIVVALNSDDSLTALSIEDVS
jgi:hypothetical protein